MDFSHSKRRYLFLLIVFSILLSFTFLVTGKIIPEADAQIAPISNRDIKIYFSHTTPEMAAICQVARKFGETIEQQSGGRVKFTYYWSSSLIPQNSVFVGVREGIATMAYYAGNSQDIPFTGGIMSLPFMGYPSMSVGTDIFWQLFDKFPEIKDEFSGIKVLAAREMSGSQLHLTRNINISKPVDMVGIKLGISRNVASFFKEIGAIPVVVTVQEIQNYLKTGLIDGVINHWPYINNFEPLRQLKYHIIFGESGLGSSPDFLLMNSDAFSKLPSYLQEVIIEAAQQYQNEIISMSQKEIDNAVNIARSLDHTFTYLNDEQIQFWATNIYDYQQEWIGTLEAQGKPARQVFNEAKRLIGLAVN